MLACERGSVTVGGDSDRLLVACLAKSIALHTYIHTYKQTHSIIYSRGCEHEIGHKEERERKKRKKRNMMYVVIT
jgi:hypothetical protein